MMHAHHKEILGLIKSHSGTPTQHTFLDSYLGNDHPRYPISVPVLRKIAKSWIEEHRDLTPAVFVKVLTSLIHGVSSTEKCMAGILLDLSGKEQRKFDPEVFDGWLDQLIGWAEVDSVCTGAYTVTEIPSQLKIWKKILVRFSKSKNIQKRRASIVLLCSPLRKPNDEAILALAFENCDRLKSEKEVLITKAISWVLRCGAIHHPALVRKYVDLNKDTLPKIAVRETMVKLTTGKKNKSKKKSNT